MCIRDSLELARDRDELLEVLQPGLVLRIGGPGQFCGIAGALEHSLEDRRWRGARLDQRPEVVEHGAEALHRGQ